MGIGDIQCEYSSFVVLYGPACSWLMITMKIMMLHSCEVKYIKIWLFFMYFLSVNLKNMQFLPKCNFVCHFLFGFFLHFFFLRFNYILFLCFIEKLCCLSKNVKRHLKWNEWMAENCNKEFNQQQEQEQQQHLQ